MEDIVCPLCKRECPSNIMEKHHLQTRRKDKADTELICRECHKTIHALWTNTELRDAHLGLDTVEGLLEQERFLKAVKYIAKLTPGQRMKMSESNHRKRKRGRR